MNTHNQVKLFAVEPKTREWSPELYDHAIEFHGHGGPFMVIGLRMGLEALRILDARGWFEIKCTAMLRWMPPDSCVIDGIQVATGCTMGKHNIDVIEREGVAAIFKAGEKTLTISLRSTILAKVRSSLDEDHVENIEWLISTPSEELFDFSP
jgi:formylmethanofuran dehydrogenase subunit E